MCRCFSVDESFGVSQGTYVEIFYTYFSLFCMFISLEPQQNRLKCIIAKTIRCLQIFNIAFNKNSGHSSTRIRPENLTDCFRKSFPIYRHIASDDRRRSRNHDWIVDRCARSFNFYIFFTYLHPFELQLSLSSVTII